MKLSEHFDSFLEDTVNLNQTRIDRLEGHVKAIQAFLLNSDYDTRIIRFSAQGSWAHETIIKPLSEKEFDADLVMFVDNFEAWSPKDYVNNLYHIFKSSNRYKEKVSRGTRCVALDYAGDFHLDIVPCITEDYAVVTFHVCNRTLDTFETTAPESYSAWLSQRNTWTGDNMLQHSIRLLKYLRDIKTTFSVKSILLTTLIGNCVNDLDKSFKNQFFPDLPTSLKTLVGRLDDYLQASSVMPIVTNPVLPLETFNRHWNQEKYENFRECMHRYRDWIDDAYEENDRTESIRKWRKIFGDEFAKGEVNKIAAFSESTSLVKDTGYRDVVNAVLVRGAGFLEHFISPRLPHVEKLSLPFQKRLSVVISATEYLDCSGNQRVRALQSGDIVEKDRWIRFEARNSNGILHASSNLNVKWQVVNTDSEAVQANQLRGGFEKSDEPGVRWETTAYHGAHWVEAFTISQRTGVCWGRSGRFFIVVE